MNWCLLASFVRNSEINEKVNQISKILNIHPDTIFVLDNLSREFESILTYNVLKENLDYIKIHEIKPPK